MNAKLLILVIIALLLPITALAAADFQDVGSLTFPGGYRATNVSTTFTVKNTGTISLTNVRITDNINPKYNIIYSLSDIGALNAGQERAVEIKAAIPNDETIGKHSIGTVTITSNEISESFALNVDVKNRLIIEKVEMVINGQSDTLSADDETSDDNAEPGDEVKLNIKVNNMFSSSDDVDIENIVVTATMLEINDGDDLEEESSEFDLEADKYKTEQLIFNLPSEVEDGEHDIEISVEGESSKGRLEDSWTVHFNIDKRAHDIIITKAALSEETVNCGASTTLDVELLNIGDEYEEEAALEAKNMDIGLNFHEYDINLNNEPWEEDTRCSRKITINVPSAAKEGTYPITIRAFFDRTALDFTKILNLAVNCKAEVKEEPKEAVNETAEPQKIESEPETAAPADETEASEEVIAPKEKITESVESPLIKNMGYLALLIIGNVIILGLIAFLAVKAMLSWK